MQKLLLNKKFLIGLSTLAIVTLIYSLFSSSKNLLALPTIIKSTPAQGVVGVDVFRPITIQYDKNVFIDDLDINSEPSEKWELIQVGPDTIGLTHKLALRPSTKYSLILSWKNQPLSPLVFTTLASQGDPRLVQTLTEEFNRDYPLAKKTPYISDTYYVVYSAPMVLEITIKNPAITPEKAFSEIRAWVTSVGGDANAHKYVISDKPLPSTLPPTFTTSGLKPSSPSPTPFDWDNLKDDGT